ncbi:MAG: proteasome accessory factor PafA2 family protein [Nitrospira sp.]|nr:proteasome accessory factor PafA2 family protein [Nitrospira sp.]
MPNGARFYNDHTHPEYSTPECRTLRDLVAHDRAGERIVHRAAQRRNRLLGELTCGCTKTILTSTATVMGVMTTISLRARYHFLLWQQAFFRFWSVDRSLPGQGRWESRRRNPGGLLEPISSRNVQISWRRSWGSIRCTIGPSSIPEMSLMPTVESIAVCI